MGRKRKSNHTLPYRVYQDGKSGVYYYKPKHGKSHNLGSVLHQALTKYCQLISDLDTPNPSATYTVEQLINRYMAEISPTKAKSTHRSNINRAQRLNHSFGHFLVTEVTKRDVQDYAYARLKKATVSVNRELSLLSSIFRKAFDWGIDVNNPTIGVTRFLEKPAKDAKKLERYITDEELLIFYRVAPEWMKLYIELKLVTGLRQVGMLSLTKEAIQPNFLFVKSPGKNSKPLSFIWTPELRDLVHRIQQNMAVTSTDCFFSSNDGTQRSESSFRTAWQKTKKKAVENGLERPFAERYIRNKAVTDNKNSIESSMIVGHSSPQTTINNYEMKGTEVTNFAKSLSQIQQNLDAEHTKKAK